MRGCGIFVILVFTAIAGPPDSDLANKSRLRGRGIGISQSKIARDDATRKVPRGYALIIGVSKYANLPGQDLHFAESDAEAIHDVLINQESGNFEPENVRKLIGRNATLANITDALERWLPSVAAEQDRVVIYFAGHGFILDGKGYLAPFDVDLQRLEQTAFAMDRLNLVAGKRIKARWKVLLTDACHSGSITPQTTNEAVNESLSNVFGVLSLTAARKNERSFEDSELGAGVFSYFLAQGLRGQADFNRDGVVSAAELVEYVRHNVYNYGAQRGEQQSPHENQDFSADFVLAFNPSLVGSGEIVQDGEIAVQASMPGVEFFLDGNSQGIVEGSKNLPGVAPGTHTVEGAKRGYESDGPRQIVVYPGKPTSVILRPQVVKTRKPEAVNLFNRGLKLYTRGSEKELREAAPLFDRALEIEPSYAEAALYLGRTWQVLYDDTKAEKYLKKAVDLDKNSVHARLSYASLLLDRGDTQNAIVQLRHAIQVDPLSSLARSHMAQAYRMAGNFDRSVNLAEEALKLDASNAQAFLWMGDSLRGLLKFDKAKEAYTQYLRFADFEPSALEKFGYYMFGNPFTGTFSKRRASQKQIDRDQRNLAYFGICECENRLGKLESAIRACSKALSYDSRDIFSLFSLGELDLKKFNLLPNKTDPAARPLLWASRNVLESVVMINPDVKIADDARNYLNQINATLEKLQNR